MGKGTKRARLARGKERGGMRDQIAEACRVEPEMIPPTEAQQARALYVVEPSPDEQGRFDLRKKRCRRVPVIDTMLARGELTETEHKRLAHYRDQASLADRSLTRSCLAQHAGGGTGMGPSAAVVSAIVTTARIERDLGSLADITRAVAVDDMSLTEWCVAQHGGRERYDGKGRFIAIVPVGERDCVGIARMDLKYAAGKIVP